MPRVIVLVPWLVHRPRRRPCTTVVLHATAGSTASGAISTLRRRKLSYHYIIAKDGVVYKCAPMEGNALHAGLSLGPDDTEVNGYSIGIAFVNRNNGKDRYTQAQVDSAAWIVSELKPHLPLTWVTSHAAISPGRKTDPKGFAIQAFADRVGLDLWTQPEGAAHVGGIV